MIGKPYSGKLNVRFDEGELEIGLLPLRQFSTLPVAVLIHGVKGTLDISKTELKQLCQICALHLYVRNEAR